MRIFLLLLFMTMSLLGFSQEPNQNDYAYNTIVKKTSKSSTSSKSDNKKESTFKAGEWLKFRMHYGALNASYATLHVKNDKIDGVPVYHVVGKGKTTGWASLFFKVDDTYESYFSKEDGRPLKFKRRLFLNDKKSKKKNNTFELQDSIQDLISAFYYLRNNYDADSLEVGKSINMKMLYDDDGIFNFKLKYMGKEVLKTKYGKVECHRFMPLVQSGRVFKEQESLSLWVSTDKNRIPIRISADLAVGAIKADLDGYNDEKKLRSMNKKEKIDSQILKLEEKYKDSGQDLSSYLDGLLYQRYLTYWDYIHLDTLLSLQVPRTYFPDEEIFIMYHQITELYFKLILHEQKQLVDDKSTKNGIFIEKVRRINSYYQALISSFSIMIKGMERKQFLQYRMALLPASGFQSAQYRMIEIYSTGMQNLVHHTERDKYSAENSIEELYEGIYWKKGATDISTGEKTLTLKQFEYRYTPRLVRIAKQVKNNTIWDKYLQLSTEKQDNKEIIEALKTLDINANVNWPLMHMGSAHRYLNKDKMQIDANRRH
ncbi:Tryptophan 2,3-dioxygenase [Nymphon striatum]|nr:Tryptophan 2,3-dioxygenase [Nymphon striatum]